MNIWNVLMPQWLRLTSLGNGLRSGGWPPRDPPPEMLPSLTMQGTIPLGRWYLNDIKVGGLVWTTRSRWWNPEMVRRRGVAYYGSNDRFLYDALEAHPIAGREAVIVGSEFPWYECIATTFGATVTTIEYRPVDCRIPGLTVLTPDEFARQPRQFDAAISISSIEHDGLGRYGDPLNPDGDLHAMNQFRRLLKPGGRLFLAVPVGPDTVVWNAHRIYGPRRLPLLLSGWRQVAVYGFDERELTQRPLGDYLYQPVFVLEPEGP
jgi:SAM-dependent methyltransferase